jgi:hypothetical protein
MLNVEIAQSLIGYITFLISYVISVTLTGCFAAWVALEMGDETPAENGFLSLNPLIHIDFLGIIFILLYSFGWSRFIPINPANMEGRFYVAKVMIAFLAEPFAHFILGVISLIALVGIFGQSVLIRSLTQSYPESSSFVIAIGQILISTLLVNMILAVITFLINMCGVVVMSLVEKYPHIMVYSSLIMVIVPITLYYLFGPMLVHAIFGFIETSGYSLATLLHLG